MGLKKILVLAVIFAGLVAAYMWDQKRIQKNDAAKEEQSRVVAVAKAEITALDIDRRGEKLQIAKDGNGWKLTQPVKARTADAPIDDMLTQLDAARRGDPFDVADARLAEYGLAQPAVKVEVKAASKNYAGRIDFGSNTTDGQSVYVRTGGKGQVFTVPAAVLMPFNQPIVKIRDKRLVPAEMSLATSFEIDDNGKKLAASKIDGEWRLTEPVNYKGDDTQIRKFLGDIGGAEIKDYLDTPTLNLAPLGLKPTKWRGRFVVADGTTTRTVGLMIGDANTSPATGVYAKCDTDSYAMLAAPDLAQKIHATADTLRDKSLFTMKPEDVGALVLSVHGRPLYLDRDTVGVWHIKGEPDTPVDQGKVSQIVAMLLEMKATRFYNKGETPALDLMGLTKPMLLARVENRDRTSTETLETGIKAQGDFVWARLVNADQIVGIDWTKPGTFFLTREDVVQHDLFDFGEAAAKTITIRDEGKTTVTLTREKTGWEATSPAGTKIKIDAARVEAFLDAVLGLQWQRQLNPMVEGDRVLIQTQKLNKPPRQIAVLNTAGKPLASFGQGGDAEKLSYLAIEGKYCAVERQKMDNLTNATNQLVDNLQ